MAGAGSQEAPILTFILGSFALSIWCIVDILKSKFNGNNHIKWILAVTFLPIVGIIIYYVFGLPQKISPKTHYNCPKCNGYIRKEANTCNYCGCKLVPDLLRNKTNSEIKGIVNNIYDKTKNLSKEHIISCPYCKESIRSDSMECPFCAMFIPEEIRRKITTDNS
jgi:hypothetical protein